jgi:hypothetical protein
LSVRHAHLSLGLALLTFSAAAASITNTAGAGETVPLSLSGLPDGVAINPACFLSGAGEALSVNNCLVYATTNTANNQPWTYTVTADSHATYTAIGVSDSVSLVNANFTNGGVTNSSGFASVSDALVTSLDPTDTVQFAFFLDGTSSVPSGLDFSRLVFSFLVPGSSTFQFITTNYNGWIVTPAYTVGALEGGYRFSVSAQNLLNNPASSSYNASGSVQYSNTLSLQLLIPNTSAGDFVSNAVIQSQGNGNNFVFATAAGAPEPSAWLLVVTGIVFLLSFRRLRSYQSRDRT